MVKKKSSINAVNCIQRIQTRDYDFIREEHFQGLFAGGRVFAIPQQRLVILSLGLLNAVLLITAVVIGIYCKY